MAYKTASPDRYGILKVFARENRNKATLTEKIMWNVLRDVFRGHRLLRQHIIGDYIVDLLFSKEMLVIEIDGGYHSERQQQEDDEIRTLFLERNGYRVLRFTNESIQSEIDKVIETIKNELKKDALQTKP